MRKIILGLSLAVLVALNLAACGAGNPVNNEETIPAGSEAEQTGTAGEETSTQETTRTIEYLGEEYTVPDKVENIVITGALEAMEDAIVLGVEPKGAISVGGEFPDMFAEITQNSVSIGEKTQPSLETILQLDPDVILGSSKFPAETMEQLQKIAPTFPVSHISTNWEANLRLLGELTGKQEQAEQALKEYKDSLEAARDQFSKSLADKKVVVVRLRVGNLNIYPEDVYFNPVLYEELGLTAPDEVKAAQAQETISLEKFSEMNPHYIFLQFAESENQAQPQALEELKDKPIWKSLNAVKNDNVFINVVDPLAQGGTAWSKISFLKAVMEKLPE